MVKYVDIKGVMNPVREDRINGVNHGKRIILMVREKWTAVSSGIGVGKVCRVENIVLDISKRRTTDIEGELQRFEGAALHFCKTTEELASRLGEMGCIREADILKVQIVMLEDESLRPEIRGRIKKGISAAYAVSEICDKYIENLAASYDESLRQRARDIEDVKQRMLSILLGVKRAEIRNVDCGTVLVAREFSPSMLSEIIPGSVAGIVAEGGSIISHAAILARSMSLPAVFNAPGIMDRIKDGQTIMINGSSGEVVIE